MTNQGKRSVKKTPIAPARPLIFIIRIFTEFISRLATSSRPINHELRLFLCT